MIIMNVSVITIQVYGQYTHDNWGYIDSLIYENIEKKNKNFNALYGSSYSYFKTIVGCDKLKKIFFSSS